MKLLERYRELCEMVGSIKANGGRVHREILQDLKDVEAELQSRLWLAGRSTGSEQRTEMSEQPSKRESDVIPGVARGAVPRPSPGGGGQATRPTGHSGPGTGEDVLAPRREADPPGGGSLHPSPFPLHPSQSPVPSPQSFNGVAEVYSDGSCLGNPGPGGYGTIVRVHGQREKEISGGKARTTNNEMELTGAAEGLKAAAAMGAKEIKVVSDSEYLVKGMNSWMKGWLRNGWKTRTGDPVKNKELWEQLHKLSQGKTVTWTWVAGHAGHVENERCNTLAIAAAQQAAAHR